MKTVPTCGDTVQLEIVFTLHNKSGYPLSCHGFFFKNNVKNTLEKC